MKHQKPTHLAYTPLVGAARVSWIAPPNGRGYKFQRRKVGDSLWSAPFDSKGLTEGYIGNVGHEGVELRVRTDDSGEYHQSDWSDPIILTAKPLPTYQPKRGEGDTPEKITAALHTRALRSAVVRNLTVLQSSPVTATINVEHCIPDTWTWDVTLVLPPSVIPLETLQIDDALTTLVRTGLRPADTARFRLSASRDSGVCFHETGFFCVKAKMSASSGVFVEAFLPVDFVR